MARRCGSLSRSLMSAALRPPPPLPHLRPPPRSVPRRLSFAAPRRTMGELGCTQSLLPLHSAVAAVRLTSQLSVDTRACRHLFYGLNGKDG